MKKDKDLAYAAESQNSDLIAALASQLGSSTVTQVTGIFRGATLREVSENLKSLYPDLDELFKGELPPSSDAELGPLGAVAIGFAAGAAARLIGKSMETGESEADTSEAFPLVVAAFLAGAVAGARAVDGKL